MYLLTINCGSTSIKFKLYEMPQESVTAEGKIENIGLPSSILSLKTDGYSEKETPYHIPDHRAGLELVLNKLSSKEVGAIKDKNDIRAVGHRVVNVGDRTSAHSVIDNELLEIIRQSLELAPLHNPPNLLGIEVCKEIFTDIPHIAIFDNIFHKDLPEHAYLYGLPYEYYEKYRIRKYGFHGIAYSSMMARLAEFIDKKPQELKIVAIMLGGGASISAVYNGKSIDTSMGFTPTEGLIMSTRCGDIDPAIMPFIMKKENITPGQADDLINKKSGFLGLSRKYSDFRKLNNGYTDKDPDCIRAMNCFVYRIKKYIGMYAAVMNGIDAIIFGGGIGENSPDLRVEILSDMDYLGIKVDEVKNRSIAGEGLINTSDSRVKVFVARLDEELMIARETYRLVTS